MWNCENGWELCDHSRWTPREAAQIAVSENRRNILACTADEENCDDQPLRPRPWQMLSTNATTMPAS